MFCSPAQDRHTQLSVAYKAVPRAYQMSFPENAPRNHGVVAGNIVITMSGVRLCVRVSFSDDISETVSRIAFLLHTVTQIP